MRPLTLCLAFAQFVHGAEWTTSGNDAQRSSWVRSDPKISRETVKKPGLQLTWKVKLNGDSKQGTSLTPPVILDRHIGYRGFRSFGFVGSSSDTVYAVDTDLSRIEWQIHFSSTSQPSPCPDGNTVNVTRATSLNFPSSIGAGARLGSGRGGPARSAVGQPNQGAVTVPSNPIATAAAAEESDAARRAARRSAQRGARSANFVYALPSDGMLRTMYVSNGAEAEKPAPFLPPNANALGLIVVDDVAYVATGQSCGGVADGVWALEIPSRKVTAWKANGGLAGSAGPVIGPDGTLYVATRAGDLVAIEPRTLKVKSSYTAGQPFVSSPVLFQFKKQNLLAATTKDGRIHLLDSAALGTALHKTAATADFSPGALASWQDGAGVRWILAPGGHAIVAWKVSDENTLQPGWTSRAMISPLTPMIVNGVIFAVSSGAVSSGAPRSSSAILYALDPATGKELWNSGKTIASFVQRGGLSAGGSQVYVGTYDGTLYAFGFPIEH